MSQMFGHLWARRARLYRAAPGGGGAPAGPSLPAVSTANLVQRYQADHSTITKTGSEVTLATNIVNPGTMDLAAYAATRGAIEWTNNNPSCPMYGRKGWIFNGKQIMAWAGGSLSSRTMAAFIVCQALRSSRGQQVFSLGTVGAGNTNSATINISTSGGIAPWIKNANISASSVATGSGNAAKHMMGCQPQVIGVAPNASNSRIYMNSEALVVGTPTSAGPFVGGQLGWYAHTATTSAFGTSSTLGGCAEMIVYDVLVYNAALSSGTADAIAAALQTGYGIPDITDSMVFDGDSLFMGYVGDTNDAYKTFAQDCITNGKWMTIPAGTRVLNVAASGNVTADLYARLILANSPHSANAMIGGVLSGHNRVTVQIGVNDATSGGRTGANIYNEAAVTNSICNLIDDGTHGYKLKYDKITWAINISFPGGSGVDVATLAPLRTLLRDTATFRTDTGTTAANLDIIDLPLITMPALGGIAVFGSTAEVLLHNTTSPNPATAIYQDDTLHPTGTPNITISGNEYMVKGGVPFGGSGAGLNAAFA